MRHESRGPGSALLDCLWARLGYSFTPSARRCFLKVKSITKKSLLLIKTPQAYYWCTPSFVLKPSSISSMRQDVQDVQPVRLDKRVAKAWYPRKSLLRRDIFQELLCTQERGSVYTPGPEPGALCAMQTKLLTAECKVLNHFCIHFSSPL